MPGMAVGDGVARVRFSHPWSMRPGDVWRIDEFIASFLVNAGYATLADDAEVTLPPPIYVEVDVAAPSAPAWWLGNGPPDADLSLIHAEAREGDFYVDALTGDYYRL